MANQNDLHEIGTTSQALNDDFNQLIQPYRSELWRYCSYLTGSPWEAEDLVQETMLKAFASLTRIRQRISPKSYLFRIASNTWIDQCRRNKLDIQSYEIELVATEGQVDEDKMEDAMEFLTVNLTPKQLAVFLLIEAFDFTAKETAILIGSTEGAVNSNIHLARKKIKSISQKDRVNFKAKPLAETEKTITTKYMNAFKEGDFQTIGSLLDEHATNHIVGTGMDIGKAQIRSNSMGDWASGPRTIAIHGEMISLWGKNIVVFTRMIDAVEKLWDVTEIEIENDKIITHKSHYFCKELLVNAANELGIELDESKDLFGFPW